MIIAWRTHFKSSAREFPYLNHIRNFIHKRSFLDRKFFNEDVQPSEGQWPHENDIEKTDVSRKRKAQRKTRKFSKGIISKLQNEYLTERYSRVAGGMGIPLHFLFSTFLNGFFFLCVYEYVFLSFCNFFFIPPGGEGGISSSDKRIHLISKRQLFFVEYFWNFPFSINNLLSRPCKLSLWWYVGYVHIQF